MPESPTGDEGGRANTRSPGTAPANSVVPPNYIRIDVSGNGLVTFTTSSGSFTDMMMEVSLERGAVTYTGESGRIWTVPVSWRSGDVLPQTDITWSATRAPLPRTRMFDPVPFGDGLQVSYGPDTRVRALAARWHTDPSAPPCGCELCRPRDTRPTLRPTWNPAERQRIEAESREQQRLRLVRQDQRVTAEKRAEELMRSLLTPEERAHYEETGRVIVTGSDGNRYHITSGLVNNVMLIDRNGDRLAALCCHPKIYGDNDSIGLPMRDAHAAQILYLRHDLDKFWQTANIEWLNSEARMEYMARGIPARGRNWAARLLGRSWAR